MYDLTVFGDNLTEKFNALLTFLTAMGIVIDPTTQGISDSEQAMDYDSPDNTPALLLIEEGIFFVF
ncbi:phage holin [Bacillus mojavensis]|uniref:phage holin n=1 Tax=Bacillus mojavensis TaxID=72360 RepID=UPI002DB6CE71|nr:phage holin [Bacillus mojavensis]MEC1669878.1 phage holin [Bacillus mojavensis]